MSDDKETEQEVFEYLDGLRESGVTNMFGGARYLEQDFEMEPDVARDYLLKWVRTFGERHPRTSQSA